MAEAAAVIGLVASIASLIDLSVKIVSRVRDYSANAADVPKTFRSLADRLPLLTQALQHIESRAKAGHIASNVTKDLEVLVHSILEQVKWVEQCLERIIPASSASRLDRVLIGFRSLAKDEKVKQAMEKIHHGIDVLVLHQTTSTVEVSDHILQELSRLSLQSAPAKRAFGLCLGQAPLIEPDAFIGRQAEIEQLHGWLSPSQNAQVQRVVSIVGMGGLGKTQLSLAYARKYGHQYSSVFWLSAKDKTSLRYNMSSLAAVLFSDGIATAATADNENMQVEKVRRWFSEASNDQWLIIFDNYDDPSLPNVHSETGFDIRQFFPTRTHGSILITTRSSKLAFSKPLRLRKLDNLDSCIAVLSRRSGREMIEDPDSRRLAVRLDGLPLALAVAGTYLAQVDDSCTEYLNLYETAWNDLHGTDAEKLMEYEDRTLSSTWTISLNQIRRQDADAAELLQFFGYLNNSDIWYELIKAGAIDGPSWLGRLTSSKVRFDRTMSKLGSYSLVEVQNGSYRLHPCLHDWIFEHLNTPLNEHLFVTTVLLLKRSIPDTQDPQHWAIIRRLLKHINRIQYKNFGILWDNSAFNEDVLDACYSFGTLYKDLWELKSAEQMYTRALTGYEKVLGPDHDLTLLIAADFGNLCSAQGKLAEAEQMLSRALLGQEKILGSDDVSTLWTLNILAVLYLNQGKLDAAEQAYTRVLAGFEKTLAPDHTTTLETMNGLGVLYANQSKLREAEQMHMQTLARCEQTFGSDHVSTLDTVYDLGTLYRDLNRLDKSERMHIRALTGYEKTLGHDHVLTLRTVNQLALLYWQQSKFDEAEQMLRRVVDGFEVRLGSEHPETQITVQNLESFQKDRNDLIGNLVQE